MALLTEPFHVDGHDLPMTASIGIVERAVRRHRRGRPHAGSRHDAALGEDGRQGALVGVRRRPERSRGGPVYAGRGRCRPRSTGASSRWCTNRSSVWPQTRSTGSRRWRAGTIPSSACSVRPGSSTWPRTAGSSSRSGCVCMEQACRQAATWRRTGSNRPYVSVNLAVRQIRHPHLVADVAAVLDRTGLPPHMLQLEITESAVMGDDPETVVRLHDLAGLRVRLAIDDFGTGYSNLAYLRTLPVHSLKLAGQFVDDLRHHRPGAGGSWIDRLPGSRLPTDPGHPRPHPGPDRDGRRRRDHRAARGPPLGRMRRRAGLLPRRTHNARAHHRSAAPAGLTLSGRGEPGSGRWWPVPTGRTGSAG